MTTTLDFDPVWYLNHVNDQLADDQGLLDDEGAGLFSVIEHIESLTNKVKQIEARLPRNPTPPYKIYDRAMKSGMTNREALSLTAQGEPFRTHMPYTFQKLDGPRFKHIYLPLNRNYDPLGTDPNWDWRNHRDWSAFFKQAWVFRRDPRTIENIWIREGGLHLYNDDPFSRKDYLNRYVKLLRYVMHYNGYGER
jgi:hypothetical protein